MDITKPVPNSHDVLLGIFSDVYYRPRRYLKSDYKYEVVTISISGGNSIYTSLN